MSGEYGSEIQLSSYFDDTYDTNIRLAYLLKVVSGNNDNKFNPERKITRQEAAVMITRLCRLFGAVTTTDSGLTFADIDSVANWARSSIDFVSSSGIMTGTSANKFSPLAVYTYEQACVSLLKAYEYVLQK